MKAQTFLEWYKDNSCFSRATIDEDISSLNYVANFYSQPFKPEMITELFEGWVKQGGRTRNRADHTAVFIWATYYEYVRYPDYSNPENKMAVSEKVMIVTPPTLNDFISDCNRAGIELHWKPEIEKEFFSY